MFKMKYTAAEFLGAVLLLAVLFGYILLMGAEIITGSGLFLMLISIIGYLILSGVGSLLFTKASQNGALKRYWITYAAKIAFVAALLLFSPLISDILARLING